MTFELQMPTNEFCASNEVFSIHKNYRCVLCKSKVLFCMFRIELLNIETKQRLSELISLFSDLYAQNMGASLVIFYHNKADETIIQVDKIEEKHLLKYNKTIYHNGNDMNLRSASISSPFNAASIACS